MDKTINHNLCRFYICNIKQSNCTNLDYGFWKIFQRCSLWVIIPSSCWHKKLVQRKPYDLNGNFALSLRPSWWNWFPYLQLYWVPSSVKTRLLYEKTFSLAHSTGCYCCGNKLVLALRETSLIIIWLLSPRTTNINSWNKWKYVVLFFL